MLKRLGLFFEMLVACSRYTLAHARMLSEAALSDRHVADSAIVVDRLHDVMKWARHVLLIDQRHAMLNSTRPAVLHQSLQTEHER